MTTMIAEVYSAFRTAGVPEEEARKAAEALSAESLATKNDIADVRQGFADVKRELTVVKWMLGIVIAAQVLPFLRSNVYKQLTRNFV